MKNKYIAGIFALTFGVFGLHRFYLGQRMLGLLYFTICTVSLIYSIDTNSPPFVLAIFGLIAFMDALLLFVKPKEEFDRQYNNKKSSSLFRKTSKRKSFEQGPHHRQRSKPAQNSSHTSPTANKAYWAHLRAGKKSLNDFCLDDARAHFTAALREDSTATEPAYLLATVASLNERASKAYAALAKAFDHGFDDWERIAMDDNLAWIRTQPDYPERAANKFHAPDKMATLPDPSLQESPLEQLNRLKQLRDRQILTEAEYAEQAARILKN